MKTETIIKTYKYRLLPSAEQEAWLFQSCTAVRHVYNAALERITLYSRSGLVDGHGRDCSYKNIRATNKFSYKEAKKDPDLAWIGETLAESASYALKDLNEAFQAFFKGRAKYPSFRKFSENNSFTMSCFINQTNRKYMNVIFGQDDVKLPKIGYIPYIKHKNHKGKPKNATVIYQAGYWFICVTCEITVNEIKPNFKPAIGVDLGVALPVALSNGESFGKDKGLKKLNKRNRQLQRELSRCKKGSNRRKVRKQKVAANHRHISARRKSRNHEITTKIAREFGVICIEDLKVSNMTKSAKGTVDNPGKNVKAKSSLNREILNVSPNQFRLLLEYKTKWWGGEVRAVHAAYTSQTCSSCGVIDKTNRKSQSEYICNHCGYKENADINAARNILSRGVSGNVVNPRKTPSDCNLSEVTTATSNPSASSYRVGNANHTQHLGVEPPSGYG